MPADTKPKPAPARVPSFSRAQVEALAELDDFDLAFPGFAAAAGAKAVAHRPDGKPIPDLTGKPKVWFLMARGRSGKTMLARWVAETVLGRGGEMLVAALDQGGRRSLTDFIEGVEQPPSTEPGEVSRWLEGLLQHVMEHRLSAVIDFGGGDTSLGRVLATVPDLAARLTSAGIECVACYPLGPAVADLSLLATNQVVGFEPHTLIVENEGLCDPTAGEAAGFAGTVERHVAYQRAVSAGAVVVRMPRLDAAVVAYVERMRCHFTEARDGVVPEGRRGTAMVPFDRAKIGAWLGSMGTRLEPVRSWLPE